MTFCFYGAMLHSNFFNAFTLNLFTLDAMGEKSLSLPATGKSIKIKDSSIFTSHDLGKVDLYHNDEGFHVLQDNELYTVKRYSMDPLLRNIKHKQLKKFQKVGYINVKKIDNDEFALEANVRGLGGGPVFGSMVYWGVKALFYGGAVGAAGVAVGASGGEALVVAGAAEGLAAAGALGAGSGLVATAVTVVPTLGTIAAGGTTVGVIASSTVGVGAVVTFIEGVALAAGLAAGMAPTL